MTDSSLTLVSHSLCPYVQRAAIALAEKNIAFERRDVDLAHKPDWFLQISPLGKTPVLLVGEQPIFESPVICEYLEDVFAPALHPQDALERAQHRAWMEFGSSVLNSIAGFYNAPDEAALAARRDELHAKFRRLDAELTRRSPRGPFFAGPAIGLVDAVFGPVFRYFDVFEQIADIGFFTDVPRVAAWRQRLSERPSIRAAVTSNYPQLLMQFLAQRDSALGRMITMKKIAA